MTTIQSANYVKDVSGWSLSQSGEFQINKVITRKGIVK